MVEHRAADFDRDGDVDAADLSKWQIDFGLNANSDANGDGDTDGQDLLVWQQQIENNASTQPASTTVPEPPTGVMVLAGMSALLVRPTRWLLVIRDF